MNDSSSIMSTTFEIQNWAQQQPEKALISARPAGNMKSYPPESGADKARRHQLQLRSIGS